MKVPCVCVGVALSGIIFFPKFCLSPCRTRSQAARFGHSLPCSQCPTLALVPATSVAAGSGVLHPPRGREDHSSRASLAWLDSPAENFAPGSLIKGSIPPPVPLHSATALCGSLGLSGGIAFGMERMNGLESCQCAVLYSPLPTSLWTPGGRDLEHHMARRNRCSRCFHESFLSVQLAEEVSDLTLIVLHLPTLPFSEMRPIHCPDPRRRASCLSSLTSWTHLWMLV